MGSLGRLRSALVDDSGGGNSEWGGNSTTAVSVAPSRVRGGPRSFVLTRGVLLRNMRDFHLTRSCSIYDRFLFVTHRCVHTVQGDSICVFRMPSRYDTIIRPFSAGKRILHLVRIRLILDRGDLYLSMAFVSVNFFSKLTGLGRRG
jgi:hypothetical protein